MTAPFLIGWMLIFPATGAATTPMVFGPFQSEAQCEFIGKLASNKELQLGWAFTRPYVCRELK